MDTFEIPSRNTIPVILVGISMVSTKVPGDTPSLNLLRMFGYDRKWVSNVRTSSTVLVWMWPCKKRRNQSDPSAKNTSSWLLPFEKHLRTHLEFKICVDGITLTRIKRARVVVVTLLNSTHMLEVFGMIREDSIESNWFLIQTDLPGVWLHPRATKSLKSM